MIPPLKIKGRRRRAIMGSLYARSLGLVNTHEAWYPGTVARKTSKNLARWGRRGGKARLRTMTAEERTASARGAVMARWALTPPEVRREIARKAVQARWAQVKAKKARSR